MSALRTLLGLVVLLVVALVLPEVASAKSVTGAETHVGVFNLDGRVGTGVEPDRSIEHHRAFGDASYDFTSRSPHAAKGGVGNVANGPRLAAQLSRQEAAAVFTESGGLHPGVIAGSRQVIAGTALKNKGLIGRLTADGSNIADWAKMSTQSFRSPSGSFQVHFYQNAKTGAVHYADDYKAVFNHGGNWP